MNHSEYAKFETWSTISTTQHKKCRSCGTWGLNFIEVEDKEGIGWACPTCCGEEKVAKQVTHDSTECRAFCYSYKGWRTYLK